MCITCSGLTNFREKDNSCISPSLGCLEVNHLRPKHSATPQLRHPDYSHTNSTAIRSTHSHTRLNWAYKTWTNLPLDRNGSRGFEPGFSLLRPSSPTHCATLYWTYPCQWCPARETRPRSGRGDLHSGWWPAYFRTGQIGQQNRCTTENRSVTLWSLFGCCVVSQWSVCDHKLVA